MTDTIFVGLRELFDWIVDPTLEDRAEDELDRLAEMAACKSHKELTATQMVDEEVFKQVYIPRRLNEVARYICS